MVAGRRVAQRDRFGQRPLYWSTTGDGLLAGPSLLALASHATGAEWDPDAAALALLGGLPEERSLLRGVQRLPAGATLSIADDRPLVQLQSPLTSRVPVERPPDAAAAARALRERLVEAVARDGGGDAACALSGGLDSAGLLALLAAQRGPGVRTWSLVDDTAGADEREAARELVGRLGAQAMLVQVNAAELPDHAEAAVRACEEPLWNARAVARWVFLRGVRAGGEAALLTGTGADELLCGDPEGLGLLAEREAVERALARCLLPDVAVGALPSAGGGLEERRRLALTRTLPASTLPPEVRAGDAVGLEVRLPYLDDAVADLSLSLPVEWLVDGGIGKQTLRRALADLLPRSLLEAPKRPRLAKRRDPAARRAWRDLLAGWLTPDRLRDALPAQPTAVAALLDEWDRADDGDPHGAVADAVLLRLFSLTVLCRAVRERKRG